MIELKTKPYVQTSGLDFSINVLLDNNATNLVHSIQEILHDRLLDTLWLMPAKALHITIMDWISFFNNYHQDKEHLFENLFLDYDAVLTEILKHYGNPFEIELYELRVTPDAIVLLGNDDGSIARIRGEFMSRVNLPPETNQPPSIIHSTIARYNSVIPLTSAERALPIFKPIKIRVSGFCLHKFTHSPLEDLKLIKRYQL